MKPKGRLLSFYGDDFTGSTDAMEALTNSGFKTVLFLEPPTKKMLDERFPEVQCIGVAGVSRTMNPEQMEMELKPILEKIKELGTPVNHYKICSTFDSAPEVGSIGKVLEMILEINNAQPYVPIIAGAPPLNRYTVFGNHFAKVENKIFRLDEHPVMSRHPITPMQEADLLKHLNKQTTKHLSLINVNSLNESAAEIRSSINEIIEEEKPSGIMFDVLTDHHLTKIGSLICEESRKDNLFVIGSSGVEYALSNYWNVHEKVKERHPNEESIKKEQVLVVSGSCSPITSEQIKHGLKNGFAGLKISPVKLINTEVSIDYLNKLVKNVVNTINEGKNLIIYSALGPEDSSIAETREYLTSIGEETSKSGQLLGEKLGRLIKETVERTSLKRITIAGGDTSSYSTLEMGIYALEMIARMAPGAPLCRSYSNNKRFNGLEIALKGGQLGQVDYFSKVHQGSEEKIIN
ncbi:type III effector Hrp-dependent outer domain-containing protein [Lentibacillus populi]|uniref:Type III effector Hrp-dependent outer domain-containing protein n=1 Tax=Lentibacillus populi TaxID=1827502 RepID=A0A9W5X621_9BACI|nr:four-carbon acid sugar kinase family protein [Lentibacillus populi]GGB48152.1 type III effector Hrp-dependent outer domain-containing protein [Lentibacillus populi]